MKRQKNNKKISFKGKDFFGIDVHKKNYPCANFFVAYETARFRKL